MVQVIHILLLLVGYLQLAISAYSDTSETREVLALNGIWDCYSESDSTTLEYRGKYGFRKDFRIVKVAVPGSLIDVDFKNNLTNIWFEKNFFIPKSWKYERKIFLQLDGLALGTEVWINGESFDTNNTSFIEFDVTEKLLYDSENRIALKANKMPTNRELLSGIISRSIFLRSVPEILYIESVSVDYSLSNGTAFLNFKVQPGGLLRFNPKCILVQVLDKNNIQVAFNTTNSDSLEGEVVIPNCMLWWPLCMDSRAGYLYTLVFKLFYKYCESDVKDIFRMKIGIRPLRWSESSVMINDKHFYLQGVQGSDEWARKPFNPGMDLKDVNLLKWLNANAFLINEVPSEETLDIADEFGLFVILGSPKSVLANVITRYRHHPSVILWSISEWEHNDAQECTILNETFIDKVKTIDNTRPFTAEFNFLTVENRAAISKLDIITIILENAYSKKGSLLENRITDRWRKPALVIHVDELQTTKNRIRTLNSDSGPEENDRLESMKKNFTVIGDFYGNFISHECFQDDILTLVDGIFNRNREPTNGADFVRSKFRPKRSPCPNRTPRCKFMKNLRKRMTK